MAISVNISVPELPGGHGAPDCATFNQSTFVSNTYLTTTAFMLAISMMIINLLVLALMGWSLWKAKGPSIPKLLVVLLATVDFLFGVISILTQAFRYLWGYCGSGGDVVCVLQSFMANIIIIMSSLLLVLMSMERFCALRLPFKYDRIFNMPNLYKILLSLLSYSILLASLPLMGINTYAFAGFGCDFNWLDTSKSGLSYNYFRGFQGLFLMPIIFGLNMAVLVEIRRMIMAAASVAPSSSAPGEQKADAGTSGLQRRFAILTLCASASFIICQTPILVRLIQYQMGYKNMSPPDYFIKRMQISNSLVNPCLSLFFYLSNIKWSVLFGCTSSSAA